MRTIAENLSEIERVNWNVVDTVSESSVFMLQIREKLPKLCEPIALCIAAEYFQYFCSTLFHEIFEKFFFHVLRIRRINEFGAQQLLLDCQDLENLLSSIPGLRVYKDEKDTRRVQKSIGKVLKKEVGKIVILLKSVAASASLVGETFRTLTRNGSLSDLLRIMDLKGMKRSEQQSVVDAYNLKVPPTQQAPPMFKLVEPTSVVPMSDMGLRDITEAKQALLREASKLFVDKKKI